MGRRPAVSTAVGCLALVLWCCSVTVPSLASADLLMESVVVEPATGVAQGEKALVRVEITNLGPELADDVSVRLLWRRLDKETECGFLLESIG